ncbi:WhiB family transcriptional regulator [Streptomyces sp. CC208A]|uniref:WhiB family transcriptional regulator n=1 Tax=Streptomyces sp. CC208A TaxID=3044573 RepID=UPI0024A96931|nr:WhiB family transcriptional regulator [Streptomyces sp. CC208A]
MSETRAISTDHTPDWRARADCRRIAAPDWWFPKGTIGAKDRAQAADAKAICRECPVAMQCATWALDQRHTDGIFGGLDVGQRRSINRRASKEQYTDAQVADAIRATWATDTRDPLVDIYLNLTIQRDHGHVVWRGRKTSYTVAGRDFTPAQIAFEVGYGREPQGHVKAHCGEPYCVAVEHLTDGAMRWRRDHLAAAA